MEQKLGVTLFERTTRRVSLTEAGKFLQQASARLVGDVDAVLKRLAEEYAEARKEVRVGVSRSICLAHLPGLLAAGLKHQPEVLTRVTHESSAKLLEDVERAALDLAVLCLPTRMPPSLQITHRFTDNFEMIAPRDLPLPRAKPGSRAFLSWISKQRWLLLTAGTQTTPKMQKWFKSQEIIVEPFMELDNFDMIIQLVALGMGISMVPQRALATFARKSALQRIPWHPRFSREVVIVARRQKSLAPHVAKFVDCILFNIQ
jgi:DNA-binding transcriptional LysR family regulator